MPTSTVPDKTNATQPKSTPTSIEDNPNKFLLFGITYLMATPGEFSTDSLDDTGSLVKAIVHQEDPAIALFLKEAGVQDSALQAGVDFAKQIDRDPTLRSVMPPVHAGLQANFGPVTYSPTPCPKRLDAQAIIRAMVSIR